MKRAIIILLLLMLLVTPALADDPCEDNPECDDPGAPGEPICMAAVLPLVAWLARRK
jgi:hypothetical protein